VSENELDQVQAYIEVAMMFIGYLVALLSVFVWSSVLGTVAGLSLIVAAWKYERICKSEVEF